jgi:hypothetical protein
MLRTLLEEEKAEEKSETSGHFYSREQVIPFSTQPLKITSLDEELFAFQISYMKTKATAVVYPYFDSGSVYDENNEIFISDYNGKKSPAGIEVLNLVKKLIPLSSNRIAIHAADGIQIYDTKTFRLYAQRRSYNDMEVNVVMGEPFSFIVYLQDRSGTKVSLLELYENLEIKTSIDLKYLNTKSFIKSFVFKNKAVILTEDGMFHVHELPLNNNPPQHFQGINRNHLLDFKYDVNIHIWPEFNLMGMQRKNSIFKVWKIDDDLKTTELQMDIPNARYIAENPLPDGKLVYASTLQIHIFDPADLTSTLILEENKPTTQINGIFVMHDGRLGILKSEGKYHLLLHYHLHLNYLTYLQQKWSAFLTTQLNETYSSFLKGREQSQHEIIDPGVGSIVNQYYFAPVAFFELKPVTVEEKPQVSHKSPLPSL